MRLFLIFLNIRKDLGTFLSGNWDILLLFKNSFDFFILKLLFSIIEVIHNCRHSFDVKFRIVLMELVILNNGFIFIIIFTDIVHSSHKLLLFIYNIHFFMFYSLSTDLAIHYVINISEVIYVLSIQIFMIKSVIN